MWEKRPPTKTFEPSVAAATDVTSLSAAGVQPETSAPVVPFTAASRVRAVELIVVKLPPAYTVDPIIAIPKTLAFACALKDVTTPAVVTDPRRLRFFPSIVVKSPPRYTVEPERTIARTAPDALGARDVTAPVERLNAATWFRTAVWPVWSSTSVNVPPRYTVLPLTAIAITRPLVCHVESGAGAMVASAGGAHASAMPAAAAMVAIVPLIFTA